MRIRKSILLPLGFSLLCVIAPAWPTARRGIIVKGRVTLQSGSPLASSMVKLYYPKSVNKPTLVTFTDKNGYYDFDPIEPGSYLLEVYSGNETVYQNKLWLDGSRQVFEQNVTLNRADPNRIVVQYYPKAFDRERIEAAMNEVSGRFNVRRGRTEVGDTPTNAIWFGENVSLDDIKAVALALTGKSVQLKSIKPFRTKTTANVSQIQVGADRSAANSRTWSADNIRGVGNKSDFPR